MKKSTGLFATVFSLFLLPSMILAGPLVMVTETSRTQIIEGGSLAAFRVRLEDGTSLRAMELRIDVADREDLRVLPESPAAGTFVFGPKRTGAPASQVMALIFPDDGAAAGTLLVARLVDRMESADGMPVIRASGVTTAGERVDIPVVREESGAPKANPLGLSPNPTSGATALQFRVAARGLINLDVFDLAGRRIATILSGTVDAGEHRVVWDGRDDRRDPVPSGIYFVKLRSADGVRSERLAVIR